MNEGEYLDWRQFMLLVNWNHVKFTQIHMHMHAGSHMEWKNIKKNFPIFLLSNGVKELFIYAVYHIEFQWKNCWKFYKKKSLNIQPGISDFSFENWTLDLLEIFNLIFDNLFSKAAKIHLKFDIKINSFVNSFFLKMTSITFCR